jgi:H+-translocating NAD(P) transhydrogenase subunit alpha
VVDLAAESGGNCELTRPGETVERGGVTVIGLLNVPSLLPVNASETFARNILDFLDLLIADGELAPRWDDEIVAATLLTRDGAVTHEPTRTAIATIEMAARERPEPGGATHEPDGRSGNDAQEAR